MRRVVRTCGCDGADARFAPVAARKARDSAAFDGLSANFSATGRFAPYKAQKSKISAAFRPSVRRVVRRANPESRPVASEISGGAPRYPFPSGKDPRQSNENPPRSPGRAFATLLEDGLTLHLVIKTVKQQLGVVAAPPSSTPIARPAAKNRCRGGHRAANVGLISHMPHLPSHHWTRKPTRNTTSRLPASIRTWHS